MPTSVDVPYDTCLVDDFLRHPERAERYKVLFIADMHYRDAKRNALISRLKARAERRRDDAQGGLQLGEDIGVLDLSGGEKAEAVS